MLSIKSSFDPANTPGEGMMDMGYTYPEGVKTAGCDTPHTKKKNYPTLYLDHIPDGLLSAVKSGDKVKFSVIGTINRITSTEEDGSTKTDITVEINAMSQLKSDK